MIYFFPQKNTLQNDEWSFECVLLMALTGGKGLIPVDPHHGDFILLALTCKVIRCKYMVISDA